MRPETQLDRIERLLVALLAREAPREWYSVDEFAMAVGKAPFTVREWRRLGRVRAAKRRSGRGAHPAWCVSHEELLRYQREGLLPSRGTTRNAVDRPLFGLEGVP